MYKYINEVILINEWFFFKNEKTEMRKVLTYRMRCCALVTENEPNQGNLAPPPPKQEGERKQQKARGRARG